MASTASVLHLAPEECLTRHPLFSDRMRYFTADLLRCDVRVRVDLHALPFRTGVFDLVLCNHVLEHVADDVGALGELVRATNRTGATVVTIPIEHSLPQTFEDPAATTPEKRLNAYGQSDHVRTYGSDFAMRLGQNGAVIDVLEYAETLVGSERMRYGIACGEPILVCRKAASDSDR